MKRLQMIFSMIFRGEKIAINWKIMINYVCSLNLYVNWVVLAQRGINKNGISHYPAPRPHHYFVEFQILITIFPRTDCNMLVAFRSSKHSQVLKLQFHFWPNLFSFPHEVETGTVNTAEVGGAMEFGCSWIWWGARGGICLLQYIVIITIIQIGLLSSKMILSLFFFLWCDIHVTHFQGFNWTMAKQIYKEVKQESSFLLRGLLIHKNIL